MNRFALIFSAVSLLCNPVIWATPPSIQTLAPLEITRTSARLRASVNPAGLPTTVELFLNDLSKGGIDAGEGGDFGVVNVPIQGLAPHTAYSVRSTAKNRDGTVDGGTIMFTTLNAMPVAHPDIAVTAAAPVKIYVLQNDTDEDNDALSIVSTTQSKFGSVAFDANTITYTPGVTFAGADSFSYTVTDGLDTSSATVNVQSTPLVKFLFSLRAQVPGELEGVVFSSFGVPSLSDSGLAAFLTTLGSGAERTPALFDGRRIVARKGGMAPDKLGAAQPDLIFRDFRDPLINEEGHVAFAATVIAPNGKNPRQGIWSTSDNGLLKLVALQGEAPAGVPGGAWSDFRSVSLQRNHLLFTAVLKHGAGVANANDFGAWSWTAEHGVTMEIREGVTQVVTSSGSKTVKLLSLFPPTAQTLGQGRSHTVRAAGGVSMAARVTLADNSQAILVNQNGEPAFSLEALAVTGMPLDSFATPPLLPGALIKTFGFPTWSQDGARLGLAATLQPGAGGVTSANDTGIFIYGNNGSLVLRRREGEAAPDRVGEPLARTFFAGFGEPLIGGSPVEYAFLGKLKGGGVNAGNDQGIWQEVAGQLQLVAREGDLTGQANSTELWKRFISVVLGSARGPLFVAEIKESKSQRSLWAVDSRQRLITLCNQGDQVGTGTETLRDFTALLPSKTAFGVRTGFSSSGDRVVIRAEFSDRTTAILSIEIP